MSLAPGGEPGSDEAAARRAEAVRLIITRRERAPRSPRMERAFKRLIWRYLAPVSSGVGQQEDASLPAQGERLEGEGGC